ncbi:DEAD/DEAH box helicase [Nonomuraea endophytica]|uniref:SNF2 family DNA or RNA helicase n=1 Tax=Nonomuraea endophytica TaxID=714136 RepID=A0A7W8A1Z4_9ACTN|nr:DEAD/DEAH box helicase [Nonomuraea endophytica]MBB5078076.1 SNF2 family DNA or RNA helicase [Nonomuraea endophytica]
MLVVHGVWAGGGLAFWAEDTEAVGAVSRGAWPRPHPFAAGHEELAAHLGLADGGHGVMELVLPGSAAAPVPSPETGLLGDGTRPRLRGWRVPVVVPSAGHCLDLLDSGGATVRFWSVVAELALDLVRRGRVLPQLLLPTQTESASTGGDHAAGEAKAGDQGGSTGGTAVDDGLAMWAIPEDTARARWRVVLTGQDAVRFRELGLAMPPACRTGAVERGSAEVLRAALDHFADAHVRAKVQEPLVGRPRTLRDRWLAALTGPDAACPDVPELREALTEWHDAVAGADGSARVSFRLVEPSADAGDKAERSGWRVELALQAVEDPSLYVPADQIWQGEPLPGLPTRPEREFLTGLGRAVRLYPDLDPALRVAEPRELVLDTAGAFTFLRQAAPLLQAAGFGVQLPRWAGRAKLGLKLTTRTKSQQAATGQGFGLRELVDFRIDLAVGDESISEAELAELARLKVPLVRVRGQWVELDERQLKAALRAVEGRRDGELSAAEILRNVVRGEDDELPLLEIDADGVLGDLLSGQAERRLTPLATPAGIDATLRPYQERGLAWLSFLSELGLGGVLADDMGLGKTITTLALLAHEKAQARQTSPTLLVCPMSLVGNWQREAARFAPGLKVYVHHGSGRDATLAEGADLVITTYGTAQRDLETLKGFTWQRVVCDEAQAIKNSGTLQARAVRSIPTRTRLALTGTPVENHLAELWSIMEFCNPGMLGSRTTFRSRYQEPIEARQDEQATLALKRATGPFVLRRLKTDRSIITDLPEKLEVKEWCSLTPEQASLYQAVVDDMMGKIDGSEGIERRGLVLAAMAKLKQVCNHPAHLLKDGSRLPGRSGKLARLEELTEEIVAEGEKALVFTQYAEFGTMLQPYLSARLDRPVLWLHGGLAKKARDRLVDRFQNDPEPMVFLLSLKAAGVGLNLTAANHVIHVDRWWNPAVEDQATDRAFRIGQRKNVQVRKLICAGTLEERVDEMIERKKALAERVVGTGEDWLTDLSSQELREVFRLGAEAVS